MGTRVVTSVVVSVTVTHGLEVTVGWGVGFRVTGGIVGGGRVGVGVILPVVAEVVDSDVVEDADGGVGVTETVLGGVGDGGAGDVTTPVVLSVVTGGLCDDTVLVSVGAMVTDTVVL